MKIYSTYDRKAVIGKIPANTEITDYINLVTRSDYDISHYSSSLQKYIKEEQKYYLAFANYASSMKDMCSKTMYLAKDTLQALTKLSTYLYKIPTGFFDSLKKHSNKNYIPSLGWR